MLVREGASEYGLTVDDDAMRGFKIHAAEMIKFNRKMNLTTITDPIEIAIKHIVDSLAAAPYLSGRQALLDIGSGAGFPGIPLKLVWPDMAVTLIDGVARKVSFLKHVIRRLNISGLTAVHARAEQFSDKNAGRFDAVITRAVGPLVKCWQLALPLINQKTGTLIALRGRAENEELRSLREMIQRHAERSLEKWDRELKVHQYKLPLLHEQRSIVVHHLSSS